MARLYIFVGTKAMVRAGKPFVGADKKRVVRIEGVKSIPPMRGKIRCRSSKRGKIFPTTDGMEYTVHAWVEVG